MEESSWEPLVELTLYPCSHGSSVYCLCSRVLLTSTAKNTGDCNEEKQEGSPEEEVLAHSIPADVIVPPLVTKKAEIEAASCYCSASHYSTDDYDSVMMNTADVPLKYNMERAHCPLQNSDSGADLSEHFPEGLLSNLQEQSDNSPFPPINSVQKGFDDHRSLLTIEWERYWALHGESIIWKSWIEKYGAYVNPSYSGIITTVGDIDKAKQEIPDVKVSSVDGDDEQNVRVKSYSFGSSSGYEKLRHSVLSRCSNPSLSGKSVANTFNTIDSLTNVTKITLSSLDLSGESESILSGSLLSSSSTPSSDLDSRSSSESGQDESGRENDAWWRRIWKEHYEQLFQMSFVKFEETFNAQMSPDNPGSPKVHDTSLEVAKAQLIQKFCCGTSEPSSSDQQPSTSQLNAIESCETDVVKEDARVKLLGKFGAHERKENSFRSRSYVNSVSFILQRLRETALASDSASEAVDGDGPNEKTEGTPVSPARESNPTSPITHSTPLISNKRSFDDADDDEDDECRPRKQATKKSSHETEASVGTTGKQQRMLERVKAAMTLVCIPFQPTDIEDNVGFSSGHVTYRKKNIRALNRRLKLSVRTHLWFNEEGSEERREEAIVDLPAPMEPPVFEPEALGYEAHSSSVDDDNDLQENVGDVAGKKQKKKKKKQKKSNGNLPPEIVENKRELLKYWRQRYRLFLKYDEGIRLDKESWFSVTPEKVSTHQAERCRCDLIIDGFCGAGGNAIQFAFTCERVIAIDIDPAKIAIARHNAAIYGVADRIEFIVGDFLEIAPKLKADVLFLSPPWGGPDYMSLDVFPLSSIMAPVGGQQLFNVARGVTTDVAMFLPRNINSYEISLLPGEDGAVELEQNFLDKKLIGVTAYFGSLILDPDNPSFDIDEQNC